MADDKENEQTTESSEADEKPTGAVKKKAARKKAAKKAVVKKQAVSKKTTVKKRLAESAKAKAGSDTPMPEEQQAGETKPAAAAAVAAAAGDAQTPTRSEAVIKAKFIKDEPSEVSAMSTETANSGGFWVKVIFWLLIVVLGFMYIRSLAKHPSDQSSVTATGEASHEVAPPPSTTAGTASEVAAGVRDITQDAGYRSMGEADQPSGTGEESTAGAAGGGDRSASGETSSGQPSAQSAGAATPAADAARGTTASSSGGMGTAPGEQQSLRAMHEESVAKILKEFDDLREAARAETEAMRNLMQAERELRDAMTPPPPMRPAWQAPGTGYGPYGSTPQHYPPY